MRLADKVAIVTGAAGSIGAATARAIVREGGAVCLADAASAEGLASELKAAGGRAIDVPTDVTGKDACGRMVQRTLDAFGRLDILVTVAGVTSFGSASALDEAEWDRVLAINLKGVFLSCQAAIPAMKSNRSGRVVTIGSVLGKNGGNPRPWIAPQEQEKAGNVAYGAAKAGVHSLTFYLAKELAGEGITVNCVAPGPVASAMTADLPEQLRALIPVGRMGRAEEVAEAIVFLASDTSGFITGEVLDINGGLWVD